MTLPEVLETVGALVVVVALGWLLALVVPAPFGAPCGVLLAGVLVFVLSIVAERAAGAKGGGR